MTPAPPCALPQAPAWPSTPAVYSAAIQLLPVPAGATDEQVAGRSSAEGPSSEQGQLAHRCIAAVCEALVQAEAELNALDAKVRLARLLPLPLAGCPLALLCW